MLSLLEDIRLVAKSRKFGIAHILGRPRSATCDPRFQQRDGGGIQLLVRRHLQVIVLISNCRDQQGSIQFARDNRSIRDATVDPTALSV